MEKGRYYQVSSNITDTAAIINAKPKSKKILKLNIETNSILTKQLLSLEHGRIIIFKRYEAKRDSILLLSDQLLSKNDIETYKSQLNNYHNLYKNYYLRECEKIEHQFIQQNKGSAIAAYLISSAPDLSQNRIFYNLIINQLDPALKLNRYSIDAKSKLAKLSEVNIGDYFPPLAGDEISGNRLSAKFGYKLTVIQFWASFDLKSRAANKAWSSLVNAKSINKKGIEIISVSFDTSREVWKNAIIKDNLQWQQLSELLPMDECENTARFNILHLPVNYLVDGELKVIAKNVTANYVMKKCSSMN
ncbi:MAG: thioredoxin family protein [Bacteroidota bacterium]